jgi:hypothetical protein
MVGRSEARLGVADSGGGDEAAKLFEFGVATEQSRGRSRSL